MSLGVQKARQEFRFAPQKPDHDMDDAGLLLKLNVGGALFTTTRGVVSQSPFFQHVLEARSNRTTVATAPDKGKYCVRLKNNSYFVDRNPECFRDILEYLRTGKTNFLNWDLDDVKSSDTRQVPISSSPILPKTCRYLRELREEAIFFELSELVDKVTAYIETIRPRSMQNLSWLDSDCPHGGIRKIVGTKIAFGVAKDNYWRPSDRFDPPPGFRWASQSEYLSEYTRSLPVLQHINEWVHFNVGGWEEYSWKFTLNFAFLFRDSNLCGRFIHAGMKLNDISHVALFTMHAEHIDLHEDKGIQEGFAGIVLLADEILEGPSLVQPQTTTAIPLGGVPLQMQSSGSLNHPPTPRGVLQDGTDGISPPEMARLSARPTRDVNAQMIQQEYGGKYDPVVQQRMFVTHPQQMIGQPQQEFEPPITGYGLEPMPVPPAQKYQYQY